MTVRHKITVITGTFVIRSLTVESIKARFIVTGDLLMELSTFLESKSDALPRKYVTVASGVRASDSSTSGNEELESLSRSVMIPYLCEYRRDFNPTLFS